MTPSSGWSLDLISRRRLGVTLSVALLMTALAAPIVRASDYDAASDANSMASTTDYTGAQAWWAAGYTGKGIGVAVIDSGVSPVQGLDGAGKLFNGPDLSLESQSPDLTYLDTFGHGTFMAGLIAGDDGAYRGMAPDAHIVSVKVATADGGTDVSQVIAAIDWVVRHRNDDGLNIRVLNLSYGTNSSQWYGVDPLAFAVEQAWDAGIVVVAAAGNSGYQAKGSSPALANPAYDKRIIAVGASNSNGTATMADDTVPDFSAAAKTGSARAPDFVAPGVHLQGLRVRGSYIDDHVEGKTVLDERFMRGSGTSEAAAIASGAAALILDKYPSATPDQVKRLLKTTAYDMPREGRTGTMGSGELRLATALSTPLPNFSQTIAPAVGGGSIELARGTDHLTRDGVVLKGERDIFGMGLNAVAHATLEASRTAWSGGDWNGNSWSGNSWSGNSWSGNSWSGNSWSGNSWSTSSWSGNSWSGNSWSGSSWSGSSWSGNSWSGSSWSTASWN